MVVVDDRGQRSTTPTPSKKYKALPLPKKGCKIEGRYQEGSNQGMVFVTYHESVVEGCEDVAHSEHGGVVGNVRSNAGDLLDLLDNLLSGHLVLFVGGCVKWEGGCVCVVVGVFVGKYHPSTLALTWGPAVQVDDPEVHRIIAEMNSSLAWVRCRAPRKGSPRGRGQRSPRTKPPPTPCRKPTDDTPHKTITNIATPQRRNKRPLERI